MSIRFQSDKTLKLYFNEPVIFGPGRICLQAFTGTGEVDFLASSCFPLKTIDAATGSIVSVSGPVKGGRKYRLLVEGNAILDMAGNYFPGIKGRPYDGPAATEFTQGQC